MAQNAELAAPLINARAISHEAPAALERGAVGGLAYKRVCTDLSAAAGAELGNGPDVLRGVHQLEL
jgi:hypothetical protein